MKMLHFRLPHFLQAGAGDHSESLHVLVSRALAAMRAEAQKTARSESLVHNSICHVLQVLGMQFETNVVLENGLLCVQILLEPTQGATSHQQLPCKDIAKHTRH
jgi:hypothetical protein